ncbi:MAG: 2-oxoacid:ferredoxin oxidoreductase subunit beta [Pseudomonadota bacterium]
MSYIRKPAVTHPKAARNKLGLSARDYEGVVSTLCAGCGHDSVTNAIVQAVFELDIEPHRMAKMSGIGCSSKTPAYFVGDSHGFNSVHGRMPSVTTGANAANRSLTYLGVSGDGDSLSIGMGQFTHAIRRNLDMCYVIENNGVYGLTKGQFSASADVGSKPKKGEPNRQPPIDPASLAISIGATFVARSFSGDKDQLVPLLKAAMRHKGFALLDVISPCVTFNDHEGSTKSYSHTREFYHVVNGADFIPPKAEIKAAYDEGDSMPVELHDGSKIVLRKVNKDFDPTSRRAAYSYLRERADEGEILTGLLYIDKTQDDMHGVNDTASRPLVDIPYEELNPGREQLQKIMRGFR